MIMQLCDLAANPLHDVSDLSMLIRSLLIAAMCSPAKIAKMVHHLVRPAPK
jgi:hypothetical protein